jgi:hypothetical protein
MFTVNSVFWRFICCILLLDWMLRQPINPQISGGIVTMKKNLLFKIGASLLAIFLMTACSSEDTDQQPDTEETETDSTETEDGAEEETE